MDLQSNNLYYFVPTTDYISKPIYYELKSSLNDGEVLEYIQLLEIGNKNNLKKSNEAFIKIDDLEILDQYFKLSFLKKIKFLKTFVSKLKIYRNRVWKYLDKNSPKSIITTGETITTMICLDWARQRNKVQIVIQPSFILSYKTYSMNELIKFIKNKMLNFCFKLISGVNLSSNGNLFGTTIKNNNILLFEKNIKNSYTSSNKVHIIKNPIFFKYLKIFNSINYKKNLNKLNVLICIQNFLELEMLVQKKEAEELNKIYYDLIKKYRDFNFIIKIHPNQKQDYDFYKEYFRNIKSNNFVIVKDLDFIDVISQSFLHLSSCSYTSFEAVMAGIPTINLKPNIIQTDFFKNEEIQNNTYSFDDLLKKIKIIQTKDYYRRFLSERKLLLNNYFNLNDNFNRREVFDLINSK